MLLYLPALVTSFPRTFIIKGNAYNGRNSPDALVTLFPTFFNEETTGCINEEATGAINDAAIGAIIAGRKPLSCFLFHVLLFQ